MIIDAIEDKEFIFFFNIFNFKTRELRVFTIIEQIERITLNLLLFRKNLTLRSAHATCRRFFLRYGTEKLATEMMDINIFLKKLRLIALLQKQDTDLENRLQFYWLMPVVTLLA